MVTQAKVPTMKLGKRDFDFFEMTTQVIVDGKIMKACVANCQGSNREPYK